ncbi:protocadherin Fat 3, partial [Biomphalaria glabrata]
ELSNVNGSSVFYVKEDEPVGFVIVQLEYTNPDNKSLTLKLENNGGGPFVISSNNLQLSGLLDYAASKGYRLTISLNDGASIKDLVTLNVNVLNFVDITVYNGNATLNEESPVGTIVPFNYTLENMTNRTAVYTLV